MSTSSPHAVPAAPAPHPSPPAAHSPRMHPHAPGDPHPRSSSPAQLAALLSTALRDADSFRRELAAAARRADKAEGLLAKIASSTAAASPPHGGSPAAPNGAPKDDPAFPPAAVKLLIEYEARADRAERERDEAEARLRHIQESWANFERYAAQQEARATDLRTQFGEIVSTAGGSLIPVPPNYFAGRAPTLDRARHDHRRGQPFPALPPPPVPGAGSSSRVRPRSGSFDGAYSGTNGVNGAPPAKRPRSERERPYSASPSRPADPYTNGVERDGHSYYATHGAAPPTPYRGRDDPRYDVRYAVGAPLQHGHAHGHSHSRRPRSHRASQSRSRSRASSMSLDDLLLEATQADEGAELGDGRFLDVPHARAQLHPSGSVGAGGSPPGALALAPQVREYQTHVFTPPVTGAPVKKSKGLAGQGSVLTLGPTGSVIAGPAVVGGGFPAQNEKGERICRQCGMPGRYKDGKCVEKWGPGPEGPGTVCDRCRKKMKRVERRGTMESAALAAHAHHLAQVHGGHAHHPHGPAAIHPSHSQHYGALARRDTLPAHARTGPLLPSPPYAREDVRREREREQRAPPTPPYIATLPGASVDEYRRVRHSGSSSASSSPPAPREADADGEDVDAEAEPDAEGEEDEEGEEEDGDAEEDAEAELLEAVDAAEQAGREDWMKTED